MDKQGSDLNADIGDALRQISAQLKRQEDSLNSLKGKYESLAGDLDRSAIKRSISAESIRLEKEQRDHIDVHFRKLTKTITIVGFLLSALGIVVGYIGLDKYVPYMLEERLKEQLVEAGKKAIAASEETILNDAQEKIFAPAKTYLQAAGEMLKLSKESLRQANIDKKKIGKNDLIVLQTDFGADSPYMGVLKGAIYQINERARIDVITEEVPAFRTIDAAWILSRAVELYPKNTIFVSITGDPGKSLKAPVIVRTKESALTFVGYFNGVFDLVEKHYNVEVAYEVSWDDLRSAWQERGYKVPEEIRTGPAEILGFLAGALSFTEPPWSNRKTKTGSTEYDEHVQNPANVGMEFPWHKLVTEVKYRSQLEEKDKEARVAVDAESEGHMLEGTIMHIDRFGNANTNIPKKMMDDVLAEEGWSLGRSAVLAAGIASPDTFATGEGDGGVFHLKPIPFSKDFDPDPEKKGAPLLTADSGKLQLAKNFASFAKDNPLRHGYDPGNPDSEAAVPVQTGDKVRILIKPRLPTTYDIICEGETDGFEECKRTSQ